MRSSRNKIPADCGTSGISGIEVARSLRVLRSGYSEWKKTRGERERRVRDYAERVRLAFEESGGVYGADRICGMLRSRGYGASFRKVRECMISQGPEIDSHAAEAAIAHEQRSVSRRGVRESCEGNGNRQAVSGDIERHQLYPYGRGGIRVPVPDTGRSERNDPCGGDVGSHEGGTRARHAQEGSPELGRRYLRFGGGALPSDCIFHSDRGSQYASEKVMKYLGKRRIRQSFSRVGTPGGNSWSESFFPVLKKESLHWVHFHTREDVRQAMSGYIEGFYNTKRVQKRLGYLSPSRWLNEWYCRNAVGVA